MKRMINKKSTDIAHISTFFILISKSFYKVLAKYKNIYLSI